MTSPWLLKKLNFVVVPRISLVPALIIEMSMIMLLCRVCFNVYDAA